MSNSIHNLSTPNNHATVTTAPHPTHPAVTDDTTSHPTHLIIPTVSQDNILNMESAGPTSLAEMLSNIDSLEVIPKLQVESYSQSHDKQDHGVIQSDSSLVNSLSEQTSTTTVTMATSVNQPAIDENVTMETTLDESEGTKSRVGRPRTKPPKEKATWHYHLGGVRQSRTPLTPEIKEVLEVAYVSKIMAKTFRKEGQPEKERIARITGLPMQKVQEWFKNRRKKDKLLKQRQEEEMNALRQSEDPEYPITMEAVERTEKWFKNRKRTKTDLPKQRASKTNQENSTPIANIEYQLTVNSSCLEQQLASTTTSTTTQTNRTATGVQEATPTTCSYTTL